MAAHIGDGVFVLCQPSDQRPQSVVVTEGDLRRFLGIVCG